jgi:uncharacterized protein
MIQSVVLSVAAALLLPGVLFAYTNPGNPTGFVNDYAHMFSQDEREALEATLVDFEKQSSNEIAVVTINSLGGDTVENFAVELFDDWNIGKEGEDNGILIVVAKEDREMRIEVGYGLEGEVTDLQASRLIERVLVPAFIEEEYGRGITEAVELIIKKLGGEGLQEFAEPTTPTIDWEALLTAAIFLPVLIIRLLAHNKSWWFGGVLGGVAALVATIFFGFLFVGLAAFILLVPLGFLLDFIVSRNGSSWNSHWTNGTSGRGGWGSGGGFGGFGGGSSGGGGASGRW